MTKKKRSTIQQDGLKALRDQYFRSVTGSEGELRDVLVMLIDSGRVHPLPRQRTLHDVSGALEISVPVEEWPLLLEKVQHPISRSILTMLLSRELGLVPMKDGCKRLTYCGTKRLGRTKRPILAGDDNSSAFKQAYAEGALLEYLGAPEYIGRNGWMDLQMGSERLAVLICEDGREPKCFAPSGADSAPLLVYVRATLPDESIEFLGWGRRGEDMQIVRSRSIEDLRAAANNTTLTRTQ